MENFKIRMATLEDALNILEVYKPYVKNTAITFEYIVPTLQEMEERIKTTLKKFPYLVVYQGDTLLGYAYASHLRPHAAYQYSAEVSIYIDESKHSCGLGSKLYDVLEAILKRQNIVNVYACISYPNERSIAFHEKRGYQINGQFHQCGYKLNQWWDMVWMEKCIAKHHLPNEFISIHKIVWEDLL